MVDIKSLEFNMDFFNEIWTVIFFQTRRSLTSMLYVKNIGLKFRIGQLADIIAVGFFIRRDNPG
jgi:hypothetical protein